ncbi:MAG: hypothetical protein CVU65_03445 [Deltaproteobacteria bacterium HGW-Deltaproteobacteria-22]|nr:MAG: hypothetical protein CVU65_03445 [Deltaproteobacteria bacterium HGW-Deltaproteobacteria-22]
MDKQPAPRSSVSLQGRLFGELTMHRTCPKCEFGVPVNGPSDHLACDRCGELVDVASMIDGALLELRDDPYEERRSGRRYTVGRDGMLTVSGFVQLREEIPACLHCGDPLPLAEPGRDEMLVCATCGTVAETFPPPEALRERHPFFLQCIDAERPTADGQAAARTGEGASALLLGCPNCGAILDTGAKDPRDQGCAFCQTRFMIPDAAWEHLHPVRRKRRWFVELAPSPEHPAQGPLPRGVLEIAASKPEPMSLERREFLNQKAWMKRQAARNSAEKKSTEDASGESAAVAVTPPAPVLTRFRVVVRCRECGTEIPVNGPVRQVTCGTCFATMQVGRFVGNWIREAEHGCCAMPKPARKCRVGGRGLNGETHAEVVDFIACTACGKPLPGVPHGATEAACTACGAAFSTFPGPEWLGDEVISEVQCILCEMEVAPVKDGAEGAAFSDTSTPAGAAVTPVTFDCLGCGSSMPVGPDTGRICRCPFCSRDQYIPDEFWFRLHPPQVARDWFLALGGPLIRNPVLADEAARLQLSWNDADPSVPADDSVPQPTMIDDAAPAWRGHLLFALKIALAAGAALLLLRLCT